MSDDFLSGTAGEVWGVRATARALLADAFADSLAVATMTRWRLRGAARGWPRRRLLALAIERTDVPNQLEEARRELLRSKHEVRFASGPAGDRGKFENLNHLLAEHPPEGADWLLVLDDDVSLPRGFVDSFVFLAERFQLRLAQPAHRALSHAAWQVTRRRPASVARETAYVEIGPVVAFHRITFDALLPFPPLRAGWGLDLRWSAIARERGWKAGVIDATPVRHASRRVASAYNREEAIAEARRFLAGQRYTTAAEAQRTFVVHRSWR
jgi:hypothetical protein